MHWKTVLTCTDEWGNSSALDERQLGAILAGLRTLLDMGPEWKTLSHAANRLATLAGGVWSGNPASPKFGPLTGAEIQSLIDNLFIWEDSR